MEGSLCQIQNPLFVLSLNNREKTLWKNIGFSFTLRIPSCRNRGKSHLFCARNSTNLIDKMFSNCTWAGSSVSCRIKSVEPG